ncbi:MAG: nickel pincer cofactor biosynthesis protein LarC [SAR202 cluster bacterium]|nr:nickel pincer cofactor biosynthesis protein LarC [SAR202 cluster bacterium]MDP6664434.1 nickel pincer cofactor biosynthesis protein LarC [SAR202 cluster bacterium]MDP6800002.1 nickel pincer cofactor biosynthesis protein LarC [SAR202 cluster bacterium]
MKNAYFHCIGGASGDMILGAVIDAGAPIETIQAALDTMKVRGAELTCKEAQRGGMHGKLVDVELDERAKRPRAWQDFVRTVEESDLSPNVKQRATTVFERLAEAEARVHKTTIEGVHLRELGTLDTLVDVVGGIVGLETLGIERLYSSPFPTGSGVINSEHGVLPVPGPATSALFAMASAPVIPAPGHAVETGEMVTPTGAAIITTLATFRQPAMTLETVGYGLGQRESRDYPNVLALWIGQEHGASYNDDLTLIETNVDDMTGEVLGFVQERLFEAGALDVWFTPIQMKKNRPATMVSVIVSKASEPDAIALLMKETTTLGVRTRPLTRYEADREVAEADTQFGKVAVKVKRLEGMAVAVAPEYEDCRRIAMEQDLPLQTVYRLIAKDAESQLLD